MPMYTIIGRGHSGTRAISQTLLQSGVYMGAKQNASYDLIPPEHMYEACRVFARYVEYLGNNRWDFQNVLNMKIDPAFTKHLHQYLESVLESDATHKGWKIPETTLIYPWIVRLFPNMNYIFWVRDPRDSILGAHLTDDLEDFGVRYDKTDDIFHNRLISWLYQRQIVKSVPTPSSSITIRFEDFVLQQDVELRRLADFLGFEPAKIEVKPEAVGRYKHVGQKADIDLYKDELLELGYPV